MIRYRVCRLAYETAAHASPQAASHGQPVGDSPRALGAPAPQAALGPTACTRQADRNSRPHNGQ